MFAYSLVFYIYTIKKKNLIRQLLTAITIFVGTMFYYSVEEDNNTLILILGKYNIIFIQNIQLLFYYKLYICFNY